MSLGTARSCGPGAFCPHKGGLWFPSYFILPYNLLIQENRFLRGTYPAGWLHPVLFGDPQMTFLLAQDPHSGKKWVPTPPSVTIFPRSADLRQEVIRNIVGREILCCRPWGSCRLWGNGCSCLLGDGACDCVYRSGCYPGPF